MAEVARALWLLGLSHSEIKLAIHALITGLSLGGFLIVIWRAAWNEKLSIDHADPGTGGECKRDSRWE